MRKFLTEDDAVVPVHHPRVLIETAVRLGADRSRLLEGTGLTLEALDVPETRLSYRQMGVLERNALAATHEPALGLYTGRDMKLSSAGMLAIAAMNSATGREALELLLRYHSWLTPGWGLDLRIEEARGVGVLRMRELLPRGDLLVLAAEWFAAGTNELAKQVLGRSPVSAIRFAHAAPPHAALYAEILGVPVEFGAPAFEADMDMTFMAAPIPGADRAMAVLAERYVANTTVPGAAVGGAVEQIRALLETRESDWPDLEEVARALQTSGRSLRRELRRLDTSYKEVLDGIRLERAQRLVRHTDITLDRIAEQLGFSDVRTFRRAFKRWTGHTPNELRSGETGADQE
jgi:AraC-like DNA-binding protein